MNEQTIGRRAFLKIAAAGDAESAVRAVGDRFITTTYCLSSDVLAVKKYFFS